ncbi:hypothetical protein B0H13DRAFT_2364590 [Mycena leptocephala]|nr:hypothetical protein B0H13DRAFT_2364590 [Mycena leptocephala]
MRIPSYFDQADDTTNHRVHYRWTTFGETQCTSPLRHVVLQDTSSGPWDLYTPHTEIDTLDYRGSTSKKVRVPSESTEPATILRGRRSQHLPSVYQSVLQPDIHLDLTSRNLRTPAPPTPQSPRLFDLKGSFDAAVMRILVDVECTTIGSSQCIDPAPRLRTPSLPTLRN